jgi:hypothetical protein
MIRQHEFNDCLYGLPVHFLSDYSAQAITT